MYDNPMVPQMPGMGAAGAQAAQNYGLNQQHQGLIDQNINPITGQAIKPGFFGKGGMAEIGLGAIQTLGSLWNSFQQNKIAKESLQLQKQTFRKNIQNQTQTYNTALDDRIRARFASEGRSEQADAHIDKHKLSAKL